MKGKSNATFSSMDKDVEKTRRNFNKLEEPLKLRVDTSELDRAHSKLMGFKEVLEGTMLGGMAMEGMRRGFDFAKEQVKDIFGRGMEEEKTQRMMQVIRPKGGNELYEQTFANLKTSMYGTQLFGDAKMLAATGESNSTINH